MDTLTRIRPSSTSWTRRAFLPLPASLGRSKALLSKYVRELEDELRRPPPQPHHPTILADGSRQDLLSLGLGNPEGDRRTRRSRAREQYRPEGPPESLRTAHLVDADVGHCLIDFAKLHPALSLEIMRKIDSSIWWKRASTLAIRVTKLKIPASLPARSPISASTSAQRRVHRRSTRVPGASDRARKRAVLIDSNSRRKGVLRFFEPEMVSSFSVQVAGADRSVQPDGDANAARWQVLAWRFCPTFVSA